MAADGVLWFASFVFVIGFISVDSAFQVPVFMWSKDSDLGNDKPVLAGHTISSKDFQAEYLQKLLKMPQTLCLFVQDKLSVDDISQYGHPYEDGNEAAPFANLKVAMTTANSTAVLPEVDTESSLLDFFMNNVNGKVVQVSSADLSSFDIHQFSLDKEKVNLFVFHLKPVSSSSPASVSKIFSENDKLLGFITEQISSLGVPYTGLLTALDPAESIFERKTAAAMQAATPHDRLRRAIQEEPSLGADNGTFIINPGGCILIYAEGITLKIDNETFDLLNQTNRKTSDSAVCSTNSSSVASVKFTITYPQHSFSAAMTFNTSSGMWSCVGMDIGFDNKKFRMTCGNLQAPLKMSYHCGTWKANGNSTTSLIFKQLQIQPYNVEGGKFLYAYDCVGFFTIPILMGLVTVAVLLSILFLGILALLSITTMDRFDDPKGSGISMGIIQD